jgi:peptidylprolyl isomerase
MFKRLWFPGLCALIIVGLIYWFFLRPPHTTGTQNDLYGLTPPTDQQNGPQQPQTQNPVQQSTNQTTNPNQNQMQNITSATLHTNLGDITIAFNPATPKTVSNFVKLAQSGFYDGTKFHRVIAGFMDQAGDPLTKDDSQASRWGTGGPGYQFADEISANNRNDAGTIAMANAGPDTNGSQFFINAAANNFLDTKHTVFGKVTAGLDVAMKINAVKTDGSDRPVTPVVITGVTLK